MNLEQFLASEVNNAWLKQGGLSVYVRKGYHVIGEIGLRTFDIANVTAQKRGRGAFTTFLQQVEQLTMFNGVYVENVLNKRLVKFLLQRGYVEVHTEPTSSFYKETSK